MTATVRKFLHLLVLNRNLEYTRDAIMRYCRSINHMQKSVAWVADILLICLGMLRSPLLPKSLKLTDGRNIDQLWTQVIGCLSLNSWQLQQMFLPTLYKG